MKQKKSPKIKYIKETPEARKKRVSSGINYRATVFKDKRRKLHDKNIKNDENL